MDHPPLFSFYFNGEFVPSWAPVCWNDDERERLKRSLVYIVTTDDGKGKPSGLGTGFIVSGPPNLVVLTATHVLTDWVGRVSDPMTRSILPEHRAHDLARRLTRNQELLRAVICPTGSKPLLCEIRSIAVNPDPWSYDVAVLSLILPPGLRREMILTGMKVDIDDVGLGINVFAAGYGGLKKWNLVESDGTLGIDQFEADFQSVVSVIAEFDENAPGFRNGMYRARFPSESGMSGGPVFAMRPGLGVGVLGMISRDCSATNDTWVAPIQDVFALQVELLGHNGPVYFCDAVKTGHVMSQGTRAGKVTVRMEGSKPVVNWGDPDVRRCGRTRDPDGWRSD